MKIWLDQAVRTAPQRKSQIQYPGRMKSRQAWETAWPAVLETQRLPTTIPGWQAIFEVFSAEFDQALMGKVPV